VEPAKRKRLAEKTKRRTHKIRAEFPERKAREKRGIKKTWKKGTDWSKFEKGPLI